MKTYMDYWYLVNGNTNELSTQETGIMSIHYYLP
jgi:hypothetical protein